MISSQAIWHFAAFAPGWPALGALLIGALAYANRGLAGNAGKVAVLERIKARSHLTLQRSTLLRARKMNLFRWEGGKPDGL